MLQLGAIDINTNIYTPPYKAIKLSKYKCIECNEEVIFKKGEKRKPYFSHYAQTVCNYYDSPNESQLHKDAKLLLCELLNNKKKIIINSICCICNKKTTTEILYDDNSKAQTEYKNIKNNFIPDVVLLSNDKIKYIFEIYVTHKQKDRIEQWFEINAKDLITICSYQKEILNIDCIRTNKYCCNNFCVKQKFNDLILNFISNDNKNITKEINNKQYHIDIYSKEENRGIKIVDIDTINEDTFIIDKLFNLDFIINVEKQFISKVEMGNFIICETGRFNEDYIFINRKFGDIIKNIKNNIYLYTSYNKWLKLIDRNTCIIEVDNNKKSVWLCEILDFNDLVENSCLKNIINDDGIKYFNSITKKFQKNKIIYARCDKSMILLDDIHRNYVNNVNLLNNNIIAIKSVAGSGKTTTLLNIAKTHSKKKILYLAFNKSLINEIENKNIKNLYPMTIDSLIYNIWKKIKNIKINPKIIDITPNELNNIGNFFKNKEYGFKKYFAQHYNKFCDNVNILTIQEYCYKILKKSSKPLEILWNDNIKNKFTTYNGLRKLALIDHWFKDIIDKEYDMIFVDESEDFNLIMLKILLNDTTIPKIFVNDPKQSIYDFCGCINTFNYLPKETLIIEFYSTFRIGNPTCEIIKSNFNDLYMFSKSKNETHYFDENIEINEKYVYLFRSWRKLLNTATTMKNIWIYSFNKQVEKMYNLLNTVKYMDEEELESFEDDLPKFLSSLTEEKFDELINNIENNLVDKDDAICKMYTIHSFKGLENKIIKIADDIDGVEEENLYYIALTRGSKIIIDA